MWDDWMLAPAEVPATTAPRSWARRIASPTGVPHTMEESLSWLPPVMKMPVASSMAAAPQPSSVRSASARLWMSTVTVRSAPSRAKTSA